MSDGAVADKPKIRVASIMIFPNGNVAAFGADGEQIVEIQRKSIVDLIVECAVEAGYDIDGCTVDLPGVNPMQVRIHMDKRNFDGADGLTKSEAVR